MSVSGSWKVVLATKMGSQAITLHIDCQGGEFRGSIESPMGNEGINGLVSGNDISWDMKISKPIPMKARYELTVDGDQISGTAKLGLLGKAKVSGERIAGAGISTQTDAAQQDEGLVTEDSVDPIYNRPYIEVDEWRDTPVRHRYVHGGFEGTGARFSFYFPPQEQYEGRFFHNTYPLALMSDMGPFPIPFDVATGDLGFTIDSGAYYVQTNLGGTDRTPMADPAIAAYRVNAAAAKYSRTVAADLYGPHRPYGYLFGGSGGSYQTMGSAENTRGVWEGFVPFVIGCTNSIPSMFTIRMNALRILNKRNRFPAIMEAINPGGSDNPYADLNEEEAGALREATRFGFPLKGWYAHDTMGSGYFNHVAPLIPLLDPTYVDDFWSKPGYLGTDTSANLISECFLFDTEVTATHEGFLKSIDVATVPERDFSDSHLVVLSGDAKGNSIPIAAIDGNRLTFTLSADQAAISQIHAGDTVRIDNRWALALQTYHRHQVPPVEYGMPAWNQFRNEQGEPIYPQREILLGELSAAGTAGAAPCGNIHGKVLVLQSHMDIDSLAWQGDWYRQQVKAKLGDNYKEQFALWFIEHAHHDNPHTPQAKAHAVRLSGALQQALRDVSRWVEQGIPPSSTHYRMDEAQVQLASSALERGGVQPVVTLTVQGSDQAEIGVGGTIAFTASATVPEGAGRIVDVAWDFEGSGDYGVKAAIDAPQTQIAVTQQHHFDKPGTYFAGVKVTSQREGNADTPYGRIENLARVRVVVR